MISKFSKKVEYRINTQKSTVFLYTRNKHLKNELSNNYNSIKNHGICRINLTKYVPDLYSEDYKTLLKESIFKSK